MSFLSEDILVPAEHRRFFFSPKYSSPTRKKFLSEDNLSPSVLAESE
jgi:hypothetical protein